jgi:hypothetical protein
MFEVFRAEGLPLDEAELLQNIQADFCRPIGGIGVFVPDETSPTGVLRVLHGIQLFPGIPGQSRDLLKTFAFEGDVVGVDMDTIAIEPIQLVITNDIIVPGSIA